MRLIGEYTQAGAQLKAQIAAGQGSLSLTRAAAGSGTTEADAAALAGERQPLTLSAHTLEGATLTVPAGLLSVEAPQAYALSEIGLYAQSGGSEILYKIYRFDQPISIDPTCSLIATFYLNDTVVAGRPVEVTVSAAGLLTREEGPVILEGLTEYDEAPVSISCTAANLQNTLNNLPRIINCPVTITVTGGSVSGSLLIEGRWGTGSLAIRANSQIPVSGYIRIFNCRLNPLVLDNFIVSGGTMVPTGLAAAPGAAVAVDRCRGPVYIKRVTVVAPSTAKDFGFFVRNSEVSTFQVLAEKRYAAFYIYQHGALHVRTPIQNYALGSTYHFVCNAAGAIHCSKSNYEAYKMAGEMNGMMMGGGWARLGGDVLYGTADNGQE